MAIKILIDNGHGLDTPGKCSPDKKHQEWAWTREIAQMLVEELTKRGYSAQRVVSGNTDVSLKERCRRINAIARSNGVKNTLLVSIHNNAAGADGQWHNATGFSVFVSTNASANSKLLAQKLYAEAARQGLQGNRSVPSCHYWTSNLAMCRDTVCPAVLTENLFQDNKADVAILNSMEGKRKIVALHADGIEAYIKNV